MKAITIKRYFPSRSPEIPILVVVGILIGLLALSFSFHITFGIILCFIIAYLSYEYPDKVLIILASLIPFWIEWEIKKLFDMQLGPIIIMVLFLLFAHLIQGVLNKDLKIIQTPYFWLWFVFVAINYLAFMSSPQFVLDFKKSLWHFFRVTYLFFLYPLAIFNLINIKQIKTVIIALLLSTSFISIISLFQFLNIAPLDLLHLGLSKELLKLRIEQYDISGFYLPGTTIFRSIGTFVHPNGFAGFLVFTISISFALYFNSKKNTIKIFSGIASLLQMIALITTFSRGGWIACFLSISIILLLSKQMKKMMFKILPILLFIFIMPNLLPSFLSERISTIKKPGEQDEFVARKLRWNVFEKKALDNILTGDGSAVTDEFDIQGTPHNTYLYLAVALGLPALLIYLLIQSLILQRLYHALKNISDYFLRGLSIGIFSGFVGFAVHCMVDSFISIIQISLLFWFLLGLSMAIVRISYNEMNMPKCQKAI